MIDKMKVRTEIARCAADAVAAAGARIGRPRHDAWPVHTGAAAARVAVCRLHNTARSIESNAIKEGRARGSLLRSLNKEPDSNNQVATDSP